MGRCSILESIHQEAKLRLGALGRESEHLKHLLLQLRVVDTERTAAHLDAVADEVVGLGAHLLRMLVQEREIVGVGHGEGMVGGHEALLLVAPLEEREIDDPQTFEDILVSQSEAVAHLQTERAKLDARLVGVVAREDEHEVAVLGSRGLLDLGELLGRVELVDAALHRAVGVVLDEDQALGSDLRALDESRSAR